MKSIGIGIASILAVAVTAPASAAIYAFHFEGDPASSPYGDVVINGDFTTQSSALPSAIVGISGTVSGGNAAVLDGPITALSPYAASDNILYSSGTFGNYSFGGVSFTVQKTVAGATTSVDYNLYDWNGSTYLLASSVDSTGFPQNGVPAAPVSTTNPGAPPAVVGMVPEPASWALMIAGFGLVGVVARARRTTVVA